MRIDPEESLAGIKLVRLRKAAIQFGDSWFYPERVGKLLKIDVNSARAVCAAMQKRGLVEAADEDGTFSWTRDGRTFLCATAAPPLKRSSCDRAVIGLVDRIETIRDNSQYVARVESAWLFGSYIQGKERPNDVDVFIELVPKFEDRKEWEAVFNAKVRESPRSGLAIFQWPWEEVNLFLKKRSRTLSLTQLDHWVKEDPQAVKIYEHPSFRLNPPYGPPGA